MHTEVNQTRIVSPEEAASYLPVGVPWEVSYDLAGTVATESERTRRAVVVALRHLVEAWLKENPSEAEDPEFSFVLGRALAIENGADW